MNPYVAFALAMCGIVGLSLAGTAYLAAHFNRRAKADLATRLRPLAEAIEGTVDLEEATVAGRYRGQLAFGRVVSAQGGIGRLFHVELVDSAGGDGWEWSSLPRKDDPEPARAFEGGSALETRLAAAGIEWVKVSEVVPESAHQRFGVRYEPEAGMVRLLRAMRNRADIPEAEQFLRQLDLLVRVGGANRRAQVGVGMAAGESAAPDPAATVTADAATSQP